MARAGTVNAAAAALLLVVLLTVATAADAAAGHQMTTTVGGRRGGGLARPAGLTQCVGLCGETATSCLLDCYDAPPERTLLPVCLLDCTNKAMFCATDCSAENL